VAAVERPAAARAVQPAPRLPGLSFFEACGFLAAVAIPTWCKGILIRRRLAVGLAAALDLDRVAVRYLAGLRARHGAGPLVLRLGRRQQALVLDPGDVRRVLEETPDPFSPASSEKRAALSHFEPHNSLISEGPERTVRRRLHDLALESEQPVHSMAAAFAPVVEAAAAKLIEAHEVSWPTFSAAWMRMAREVVLGRSAANDEALTQVLNALRRDANWAFMKPKRTRLRAQLHRQIQAYLDRAEPGSLAARVASLAPSSGVHATDQMAQWLFAFDPAGIATYRALAVLATHPDALQAALRTPGGDIAYLRACVVESVRLWPTTPAILRQARRPTWWRGGPLDSNAGYLIFTPFLNRDRERLAFADRFAPEQWIGRDPAENGALVPFSAGPAKCPARHLVPLLGAELAARLLTRATIRLRRGPRLQPDRPLPATFDHFALVLEFEPTRQLETVT
jgi:cytochrome P450